MLLVLNISQAILTYENKKFLLVGGKKQLTSFKTKIGSVVGLTPEKMTYLQQVLFTSVKISRERKTSLNFNEV